MRQRIRRQLISTKFKLNKKLCKLFIDPWYTYEKGFWVWNVGFAIGKSNRQLNDWYNQRRNKRANAIRKKMSGPGDYRSFYQAWRRILKLRWQMPPGDSLMIDCTGAYPEQQYKVYKFLTDSKYRQHPDWHWREELKQIYWTRPPSRLNPAWKKGIIIPKLPKDLYAPVTSENYLDSFYVSLK